MTWRRQLPARSPLPLGAVIGGALGLVFGDTDARRALRSMLLNTFSARDLVFTDSGTGALTLALRQCAAAFPDAPVAVPAWSCYDLATAALGAGVPVLLYDLDPSTLAPDPASLRRAMEQGARAVLLVHLYGVPADPAPVRATADAFGAILIEDAAQGAGASVHGKPAGSFGDWTIFSFGRGKGNTGGRGGALLARGEAAAAWLAGGGAALVPGGGGAKEVAVLAAQWLLGRPSLYALPSALPFLRLGETIYHPPAPVRPLSRVAARTLAVTWPLGEREAAVRRRHATRWAAALPSGSSPVAVPAGAEPGYVRWPVVASPALHRAAVTARRLGVMPGYPVALCDFEVLQARGRNPGESFPGARMLAQQLITLPTHGGLSEADIARLEAWLTGG